MPTVAGPEQLERKIFVPPTNSRSYAGFEGNPKPSDFAEKLKLRWHNSHQGTAEAITRLLFLLETTNSGISTEVIRAIENFLNNYQVQTDESAAALAADSAFGEPEDIGFGILPVLAVKLGLEHNIAETRKREQASAQNLELELLKLEAIVRQQIESITERIETSQHKKKVINEAQGSLVRNLANTHAETKPRAEKTITIYKAKHDDENNMMQALKKELDFWLDIQGMVALILPSVVVGAN